VGGVVDRQLLVDSHITSCGDREGIDVPNVRIARVVEEVDGLAPSGRTRWASAATVIAST